MISGALSLPPKTLELELEPVVTEIGEWRVSTARLFPPDQFGRTFQTMIYRDGTLQDHEERRWAHWSSAMAGHAEACLRLSQC